MLHNARSQIRADIVAGALRPDCAVLNAAMVPDAFIVLQAAARALAAESRSKIATRSLHAELVFSVSGSKHIAETLRRFGVADDTKALVVARFDATPEELDQLKALVAGRLAPLSDLSAVCDRAALTKVYKISQQELALEGGMVDAIACRIAGRDCQ